MGNSYSEEEAVHDVDADPFGFRVLSVGQGSPAASCKLIAEGERHLDNEDTAVEGELLDRARDEAAQLRRRAQSGCSVDGAGDGKKSSSAAASQAPEAGTHSLVMFFDTIVAAGGVRLEDNPDAFVKVLAEHENKPIRLHVWNTKAA